MTTMQGSQDMLEGSELQKRWFEAGLHEFFKMFGHIIAMDQRTGMSTDTGFVNFAIREDAQSFNNLIQRVEWASSKQTAQILSGI